MNEPLNRGTIYLTIIAVIVFFLSCAALAGHLSPGAGIVVAGVIAVGVALGLERLT